MSTMPDYSPQLWGPLQLGHEVSIRALAVREQGLMPATVRGVAVDMRVSAFGMNKPAVVLIVPTKDWIGLVNEHAGIKPRDFYEECFAAGRQFRSAKIGASFKEGDTVFFHSGPDTMVYDSGVSVPFYQAEYEALARQLRPGAVTRHMYAPGSYRSVHVKRVSLYAVLNAANEPVVKTRVVLNNRVGPSVAYDQVPPFSYKELSYS